MISKPFELCSKFKPSGDQPAAIKELTEGINRKREHQVLLGVTGSGKTFTVANVIKNINMPTLVLSPNKTLAAQLYVEFKEFFPNNPVEYFISYYDYYQPEAYIPKSDMYIEKDAKINDEIEKLRLKATASLLSYNNVIVISSVSCIYGLGSKDYYEKLTVKVEVGYKKTRDEILRELIDIQYERSNIEFRQGQVKVKGEILDVFPAYTDIALRIEFYDDVIESIKTFNPITGEILEVLGAFMIFPAKHFVMEEDEIKKSISKIKEELDIREKELLTQDKTIEAYRLRKKTEYDMEMLSEVGYCNGIENYSRHLSGRREGERPNCLIDYFKKPFLTVIDESHIAVPQVRGMYNGDRSRKETLVEHGFRLKSALDNRPLKFNEFEELVGPVIYVSATPENYELSKCEGVITQQIIRPTGLVDPGIEIKPTINMVKDAKVEIDKSVKKNQRVLITTLTKKMSEDLTFFLKENGVRAEYLHSEIDALKRVEIINNFRKGDFDTLVGINLLREGLDLPEVGLVIIMDADKEGFLRSERSLIQTCGRAARHAEGRVIFYADKITGSMKRALDEMERRRTIQLEYNKKYGITPKTITKKINDDLIIKTDIKKKSFSVLEKKLLGNITDKKEMLRKLEKEMYEAAENWDFELAAMIRDKIKELK